MKRAQTGSASRAGKCSEFTLALAMCRWMNCDWNSPHTGCSESLHKPYTTHHHHGFNYNDPKLAALEVCSLMLGSWDNEVERAVYQVYEMNIRQPYSLLVQPPPLRLHTDIVPFMGRRCCSRNIYRYWGAPSLPWSFLGKNKDKSVKVRVF